MTVQAVFNAFYESYAQGHAVPAHHIKVATNIMNCKTSAMGTNTYTCECGHVETHYCSCRDRHCPMCQGVEKLMWVDKRRQEAVDAPYFHVVLTMPSELHTLIYQNQDLLYKLMYKASAESVLKLSKDKRYLGAQPGFFSILHTWGQDLHYHPHIHMVVMAGGLNELNQWTSSSKKFFIPVKVLSKMFRGKFLAYLKEHFSKGELRFTGQIEKLADPSSLQRLLDQCYGKDWYSYCKGMLAGPIAAIEYLGRYTHRIAISNSRIKQIDRENVTIAVRSDDEKQKLITLKGTEFIRRFLMHVLPPRFVKVRYYGVLAVRNRTTKLVRCKELTHTKNYKLKYEGLTTREVVSLLVGRDISKCPICQKELRKDASSRDSPLVAN